MNNKLEPLELWLPDIKKYIVDVIGYPLTAAGFTFQKSDFSFKRSHGKNFEEFSIIIANQFPVSYRLGFLLQIWNHEIKTIKAAFPRQSKIENFKFRGLVLFMNHFTNKPGLDDQSTPAMDYLLVTNRDLFAAADGVMRLLQEQAIPLADQLSELDGVDAFFADRSEWSVNSLNPNNMFSDLVAAKLNRKRDYHLVFGEMMERVEQKIQDKEMGPEIKGLTEDFYAYLKK